MKMKVLHKFFIGVFILTSIILGLIFYLQQRAAGNFKFYVNQATLTELSDLTSVLTAAYQEHDSWEFLHDNPDVWHQLLRNADLIVPPPLTRPGRIAGVDPAPPQNREVPSLSNNPNRGPAGFTIGPRAPRSSNSGSPAFGSPQGAPDQVLLARRISVFNAHKNWIIGDRRNFKDYTVQPLLLENRIVGYLGVRAASNDLQPLEKAFLAQQYSLILIIGFGMVILMLATAFILARQIGAPLKKLSDATRALAKRDFSVRIRQTGGDEFESLAEDFNTLAQTLSQYEELRQQWLIDIAHELRTPISVVQGEIEAMQDGIRPMDRENLASLHDEIFRVSKIINDLHLLSQADSDDLSLSMQPVNLRQVIDDTLTRFKGRLEAHGARVEFNDNLLRHTILADSDRLQQVFSNILENSLRYADIPGNISVCLENRSENRKNLVRLSFFDEGPGVPNKDLSRIFDRLYRVDQSRSREKGGSGLGLAISRRIIEAHNGVIFAENRKGSGFGMIIELPVI
ncbi:ATP-binding protein [Desulfobacterales bacterium HSG17]|nr:ATP-binding protein [Desulfobacterales bacterium HSG17]